MQTVMRNVLLLEDEMIITIDIEETLRGSGALNIHTASSCAEAFEWLRDNEPTVAIVDPNLKDGSCEAVVQQLVERGVPFVVYSGDFGREGDSVFGKGVWLAKPAPPEAMMAAIETFEA